jgi:hypothetical protein
VSKRLISFVLPFTLLVASAQSLAADEANTLTHGMVQTTIKVGVTTQAQ